MEEARFGRAGVLEGVGRKPGLRAIPPGVGACDRGAVAVGMCVGQQRKRFRVVAPS